ncbi:MAG: 23S rRNA (adenine(2503)-C(2))-methyltransferase RlmN [Pirellulaceae bacterium]|nr:23S rRNA (adenine(2503)-C(2))-methyltransferase RlmN [Pirellulaceae bacterium]
MVTIHDRSAVERFCRERRIDPHHLRRLRHALFRQGQSVEFATAQLPAPVRAEFLQAIDCAPLELVARRDSQADAATKLVFATRGGGRLETVVLRAATGRTTLCVSSQIGCAARCQFCATGAMPLVQSLSAAEILEQVAAANRLLRDEGRRVRNVVFMGMGEPLHNEAALETALETLLHLHGFAFPPRRLLVSTVGVPTAMIRLAERFPGVRLAVSLHSAREELRQRLMPIARTHRLPELREAMRRVAEPPRRPLLIEYLMLSGVNDQRDDCQALVELLRGIPAHVNLIPYNPVDSAPELVTSPRAVRDRFAGWLREAGLPATIRYSLGSDVAAACGQLAGQGD